MKSKRQKQKSKKGSANGSPPVPVRRLTDASEILSYLERERGYSAAAIAHLESGFWEVSKWLLAKNDDNFALCLISRSTSPTYIFTLGNASILDCLLNSVGLPGNVFITCQPQHMDVLEGYYDIEWRGIMKRMIANRENFNPASEEATRLRPAHIKELNRLYRSHSDNVFSADQIKRGVYYGVWHDEELVAVAGTHIISPTYGIACLGNVLTHAAHRNQGLATTCTSAVTADLLDYCTDVVLNVEPQNLPAIRAYANLGYKDNCMIVEAFGRRRSFVGDIITKLLGKFKLGDPYEEGVKVDG